VVSVLLFLFILLLCENVASAQAGETQVLTEILNLYRLGRCPEAISVMEPFVRDNPNNIDVRMLLADCFMRGQDWEKASSQLQAVLTLAPGHVDALKGLQRSNAGRQNKTRQEAHNRQQEAGVRQEIATLGLTMREAESAIRNHDYANAQKILETIIATQPSHTGARQRLAEVYSSTRQFAKAIAQYNVLQSDPALRSEATRQKAKNLEWSSKFPEAVDAYRQYLKGRPDDAEALLALANALLWSGRYSEAITEFESLRHPGVSNVDIELALAECYEHVSQTESALRAYEAVLLVNPKHAVALAGRTRLRRALDERPRREAYQYLAAGDLEASLRSFQAYLENHPEHDETVLQIARLHSWMQQYPGAIDAYRAYLKKNPDVPVQRELARVLTWAREYPDAIKELEALTQGPDRTAEDYEHLVEVNLWTGNLQSAAANADELRRLDPENAVAAHALTLQRQRVANVESQAADTARLVDRNAGDTLAATGKFREAAQAYKQYMASYGYDRGIALTIARLHSWAADYDEARLLYSRYLQKYPEDFKARYELGNVESWSGRFDAAKFEYETVLRKDSENVEVRMALARAGDYAGDDRVEVLNRFKNVLAIDPANAEASKRVGGIRLEVAPLASYQFSRFRDSDGLDRANHSLATTFTFRGGIHLTPSAVYTEFEQNRLLPVSTEGAAQINPRIEAISGKTTGRGAYLDFRIDRSHWSVTTRGGAVRYQAAEYLPHVEGSLEYHPGKAARVQLNIRHLDAAPELNTIGAVLAGMTGTSGEMLYQQSWRNRFALTMSGGMTQYESRQNVVSADSRLLRGMARLDFRPSHNFSIGYVGRFNRFDRQSSLYFSPDMYDTHGLAYRISGHITPSFAINIDGEVAHSRILTTNIEAAIAGRIAWRLRPSLELRGLYRYGRSARTAFGSTVYRSEGLEMGIAKVF
jgi:tetratricopeptide (TPR) repeat protein